MKIPQFDKIGTSERIGGILAVLAVVTLVTHIARCGANITQTEATLFGILQFVFSVCFAWLLSRSSCKREFQESQKGFAIAAYRRIREVESGLGRLLHRIRNRRHECSDDVERELDVIYEIARGMETTTRSSISDWADIIGEEIATLQQVERLKNETDAYESQLHDSLEKMDELMSRLPASLRVTERDEIDEDEDEMHAWDICHSELDNHGSITLDGFWEEGYDLDADIRSCQPDQEFSVALVPRKGEQGPINLFDANGRSVGRITNKYSVSSYDIFARVLCEVVGSHRFPVSLEKIKDFDPKSKRVYFTVRYTPSAKLSDGVRDGGPTTVSTTTNETAAGGSI